MASECGCVVKHSPANPTVEGHHSPPTSYPLLPGRKRVVIRMCSNAHGRQHRLLNEYRAFGGPPNRITRYSEYHRAIAAYAWDCTDKTKPIPRTIAVPGATPVGETLVMASVLD